MAETEAKEPLSKGDILSLLSTEDNNEDEKVLEEEPVEKDEDEDDDKEKEPELEPDDEEESEDEEDEEETDEKSELKEEDEDEVEISDSPRRAELKAAYPDIFKKFPALDHILHREKQYAAVFPTLNSAKEAKETVARLSGFEQEVLSGDLESVLKSVKTANEGSYNKIVDNYLGTLFKVDKAAHLELTNNIVKGVLKYVSDQVKDANDPETESGQLKIAVGLLHKAMYGSKDIKGPEITKRETKNPEEEKLKNDRQEFERQRLTDASNDVISRAETVVVKYVTNEVDPRNQLPEYVKGKLIDDIVKSLDKHMKGDVRYRDVINRLYQESFKSGYSSDSKKRIVTAILRKAKTVLPSLIKAKKAEAMKGLNFRKRNTESDESQTEEKREPRESKSSNSEKLTSNRRDEDRNKPRPGESNRSFIMRD